MLRGSEMDGSIGGMFKLVGTNYSTWKSSMKDFLYCKDLYLPLYGDEAKPENTSPINWEIMHRKTCAYIRSYIHKSLYHNFVNEDKADVLWKKIEAIFEMKTAYNKASIFKTLVRLRYQDGTSMEEHLNTFQDLVSQTITMEIPLADEVMAFMLLGSLPDSWDTLVMALNNSTPGRKMSLEMVKNSLLIEEARRKERDSNSETKALDDGFVIYSTDSCVGSTCTKTDWVILTRAPYHITPHRDLFTSYSSGSFGRVMANEGVVDIVGMGNIVLTTNTGCRLLLRDVKHAPDIRLNMISVSKLADEGYTQECGGGKWKITRDFLVVAEGKMLDSLFCLQAESPIGEVNVATKNSSIDLWHKRLGYMSENGLHILAKKKLIPEVADLPLQTCVDCSSDKQHKVASQDFVSWRRSNRLDLVHTDLCYMKIKSIGGNLYFVTFVDDFSRKVWCFSMKSKEQVFEVFKEFQGKVQREAGRKLQCIRSGNGSEYEGRFEQSCRDQGIRLEKSILNNNLAVNMNKMICERIKYMLSHSNLPNSFWGEAMSTAVYLINLSPWVPVDGDIPERVWCEKDVCYKHLRVFGCRAYVRFPEEETSKRDEKRKQYILLGYGKEKSGYRLIDPVDMEIVVRKDVMFLEDQTADGLVFH